MAEEKTEFDCVLKECGDTVGNICKKVRKEDFTGSVRFNYRNGNLVNWNIEESGWPDKK